MNMEIKTVQTKKELNAFIKPPWKVYKNDPHWVPPLILDMKKILNKKKNPFIDSPHISFIIKCRCKAAFFFETYDEPPV